MRFNPFPRVGGRYGAPMGRLGHPLAAYNGASKLYARHAGGDGYYDCGGAYWGSDRSGAVYAVWTRGGDFCAYVRARSKAAAISAVLEGRANG